MQTEHHSYGTRHDSPLAQDVIAYARVRDGNVRSVRIVGKDCPVDGGGAEVTWIGATNDSALFATALHASPEATKHLHDLATDEDSGMSEEAA